MRLNELHVLINCSARRVPAAGTALFNIKYSSTFFLSEGASTIFGGAACIRCGCQRQLWWLVSGRREDDVISHRNHLGILRQTVCPRIVVGNAVVNACPVATCSGWLVALPRSFGRGPWQDYHHNSVRIRVKIQRFEWRCWMSQVMSDLLHNPFECTLSSAQDVSAWITTTRGAASREQRSVAKLLQPPCL